MLTNLRDLLPYVATHFPFVQEKYPNADLSTKERVLRFAIEHSLDHMVKTTGKIAAQREQYAHGGEIDLVALQIDAVKMLVTALNLAHALGMSAEHIATMIPIAMGTEKREPPS